MDLSPAMAAAVGRAVGKGRRPDLLSAISALDGAVFGTQNPDRMTAAIVLLYLGGMEIDAIVRLAGTDWRDLLVAAGLEHRDWPDVMAERLGVRPA
ncbi:hypothetical protein [Streptomyces sp. MP131-18]|uniref:hypothetical protein n=1 Tax=Streptomyces sp. MP131-18 TaxID=1857892 RepID=UPI00097C3D0A|nr:hypothetical protein [Streptomyces sp. MP131-18]ONK11653.1 hypothetical protein STBA_23880 [Streptomyces sp. MP131-18]